LDAGLATFAILTMWFTALVGGQIGFIDVMAGLTGTPQIPWLLGLTVLIIGLNRRRSLGFSSMLLLSLLTFLLLAGISLDLIPRMNPVSLASFWVPLAQVDPWQLPNWSSLLAISFYTYFGPSLLAPTASFVLQQDRTGRSMIRWKHCRQSRIDRSGDGVVGSDFSGFTTSEPFDYEGNGAGCFGKYWGHAVAMVVRCIGDHIVRVFRHQGRRSAWKPAA